MQIGQILSYSFHSLRSAKSMYTYSTDIIKKILAFTSDIFATMRYRFVKSQITLFESSQIKVGIVCSFFLMIIFYVGLKFTFRIFRKNEISMVQPKKVDLSIFQTPAKMQTNKSRSNVQRNLFRAFEQQASYEQGR